MTSNAGENSSTRWSAETLDTYFGPHLSELTACDAPHVPDMPDYFVSLDSNQGEQKRRHARLHRPLLVLISNFLRRSVIANMEYRDGCHALREYVSALPVGTMTRIHAVAVARFEGCLLQASAAQACLVAVRRLIPGLPPIYEENDGSAHDRLNKLGNRIRHFHEDITAAAARRVPGPFQIAPIWLTNTSIKCRQNTVAYELTFHELAALLIDARETGRMLSEGSFPAPFAPES